MRVHADNDKTVDTSNFNVSDLDPTYNSYIRFVSGASRSEIEYTDGPLAVGKLKKFVDRCPDVAKRKFEGIQVHAEIDGLPRVAIVHAEIACNWERYLVNIHDDMPGRFTSSLLLRTAAQQLGCGWQVVSSTMLECASHRFTTLMTVAEHQDTDLSPIEIECLNACWRQHVHPEVHHFVSCLGGNRLGFRKTMAAVAIGFLRLGEHSVLSMIVAVYPGPMLSTGSPPSPCGVLLASAETRSVPA